MVYSHCSLKSSKLALYLESLETPALKGLEDSGTAHSEDFVKGRACSTWKAEWTACRYSCALFSTVKTKGIHCVDFPLIWLQMGTSCCVMGYNGVCCSWPLRRIDRCFSTTWPWNTSRLWSFFSWTNNQLPIPWPPAVPLNLPQSL